MSRLTMYSNNPKESVQGFPSQRPLRWVAELGVVRPASHEMKEDDLRGKRKAA